MNLANLMAISEASGFAGGSGNFVDANPHMSLVECQLAMSTYISESVVEQLESNRQYNMAIEESISNSLMSGATLDEATAVVINEGAWESVKKHVKDFFAKIKKFIDTIIAKVKTMIDRMSMNGKQLWQKYGNDPALKDTKKLENLSFDGYEFGDPQFKYEIEPELLIKAAYKGIDIPDLTTIDSRLGTAGGGPGASGEARDKAREEMSAKWGEEFDKLSSKERSANMASELTGYSDLGENWDAEIRAKLYDKHTFTYGKDGFDVASVGAILSDPKNLREIQNAYVKLRKNVERSEKDMTSDIAKQEAEYDRVAKTGVPNDKIKAGYSSFMNKYLAAYKDAVSTINRVSTIHTSFEQAKFNQARSMFSKMLGAAKKGFGGDKKKDNNDVEIDDELMFEI